jgi:hypothetical protein
MRILRKNQKCECPCGCERKATVLVYDRPREKVMACCEHHGDMIIQRDNPEYSCWCPNCGCVSGIN